jgi:hypothetical protein
MANCPLYNGQNLNFTGNENPYGLIQKAGKKRSRKSMRKRGKSMRKKSRKTRKYRY